MPRAFHALYNMSTPPTLVLIAQAAFILSTDRQIDKQTVADTAFYHPMQTCVSHF